MATRELFTPEQAAEAAICRWGNSVISVAQHRFLYVRYKSQLFQRLSVNVAREVCEYLSATPVIGRVGWGQLFFFDAALEAWRSPIQLESWGEYSGNFVMIDGTHFFGFGPVCFMMSLTESGWESTRMESPPAKIHSPGILYDRGTIYTFGSHVIIHMGLCDVERWVGCNGIPKLQTNSVSFKYNVQMNKWRQLFGMKQARGCFTPCVYKRLVYLFAVNPKPGRIPDKLELFDLNTQQFRPGPALNLPRVFGDPKAEMDDCPTISFITNEKLVILAPYYTAIIDVKNPEDKKVFPHERMKFWSNSQLVKWGKRVFWVYGDKCFRLTMESNWEVKVFK